MVQQHGGGDCHKAKKKKKKSQNTRITHMHKGHLISANNATVCDVTFRLAIGLVMGVGKNSFKFYAFGCDALAELL